MLTFAWMVTTREPLVMRQTTLVKMGRDWSGAAYGTVIRVLIRDSAAGLTRILRRIPRVRLMTSGPHRSQSLRREHG